MILLDANVIIDHWRSRRDVAAAVLRRPDVCVCGVTLAELMHGALDQADCERIGRDIGRFLRLTVTDKDWTALGRNLFLLRKAGIRAPFQDVLLATMAIEHGMELWTLDRHYLLIQTVLADLKLLPAP